MRYGSVCSGIEAASEAWKALGWQAAFFSEIEAFPCAVLAHRYGSNLPGEPLSQNGVPNLGDMTKFEEWDDYAIDILVGGTPCQDYSIAGQRLGMAGDRGQLTLTYIGIAGRYRPRWVVWENVPGVFSTNGGRDFARLLGDLSGQKIDVPKGGWRNHGIVAGIPDAYGRAWCVRDAQYVRVDGYERAVPQRRRRVFVAGYLGDWRPAAAVLLEPEGMRGDPPPRRKTGKEITTGVAASLNSGSYPDGRGGEAQEVVVGSGEIAFDCKGTQVQFSTDGTAPTLRSMGHRNRRQNAGGHSAVAYDMRGRKGGAQFEGPHDTASIRASSGGSSRSYVSYPWTVRRLTPLECSRLDGFPDDHARIPWRGKPASQCPDGPQYKAYGNSMAINAMRSIGRRIEYVEAVMREGRWYV
ncbi:DNA cytosine methyltransferase [Martelella sp. AMO21009]